MGGVASGRCGVKDTTEDYRSIDVRHWKRDGFLVPGQAFSWQWSRRGEVIASIRARSEPDRVILAYKHRHRGEGWKDESYPVYLEWTGCHLGGERPWFRCPARGCGRRVAILYGGGLFACRDCYQLTYPCQREPWGERAARRANRIRKKLGWEPGVLNGDGGKPKGMHWSTFERLTAKQAACANASLADLSIKLGLL
jgi:hypothetical protein